MQEDGDGRGTEITEKKDETAFTSHSLSRENIRIRHLLRIPDEPGHIVGHVPIEDVFLVVWYNMVQLDQSISRAWYLTARRAIPFVLLGGLIITEFSDNASHELKTPLTILQGKLEFVVKLGRG